MGFSSAYRKTPMEKVIEDEHYKTNNSYDDFYLVYSTNPFDYNWLTKFLLFTFVSSKEIGLIWMQTFAPKNSLNLPFCLLLYLPGCRGNSPFQSMFSKGLGVFSSHVFGSLCTVKLQKLFLISSVHSMKWPWVTVFVWQFLFWPVNSFKLWHIEHFIS